MFDTPSGHTLLARRRSWSGWVIFLAVFSVSAAASLSYIYTRAPEYRAESRLEIVPARTVGEADQIRPPSLQDQPASFLTEVQALTSRPVIKDAVVRLKGDTALPDLRGDPADWLQQLVRAAPVEHTQVVELSAEGPQKDLLWRLVNAVTDAYRARTGQRYRDQIAGNYSDLKDELGKLHDKAVAKRTSVDAFRDANNIVSLERDENGVLADIENLSHSYSSSVEDLAKAQGRLQAMKKVSGTGAKLVGGKDDPTIAALEQQAAMLRDELTDLRRRYTPAYLALDSDATALTERIAGLEKQIAAQRAASQQSALATAEEDFETAQAEVERLRGELADNQKKAQHFAAGLARFKSMQDDLDHLENIERLTADRLSKMQASERESAPKVQILERAVPSLYPVGPDYTKNAAVAVSGSFALGILAVWFARFVGGSAAEPRWAEQPLPVQSWQAPVLSRIPAEPPRLSPASRVINFLPQKPPAREISDQELSTLMAGASEPVVLACVGLLSGLTPGELTTLRWNEIDFENREIRLDGESPRVLALDGPLLMLLQRQRREDGPGSAVLQTARSESWTDDTLNHELLCAAYDAEIPRPEEIDAAALRHSYVAWLFRQGIRASDVSRIAGIIPDTELIDYTKLGAGGARLALSEIDRVHPAVRNLALPDSQTTAR